MIKVFANILTKRFNNLAEEQDFQIEDAARLLCQTLVTEGKIYVYGAAEMEAVALEATIGTDTLPGAVRLTNVDDIDHLSEFDRLFVISRFSTDEKALEVAKKAREKQIPAVGISSVTPDADVSLHDFVEVHIDTKLVRAILPEENGNFFAFPSLMMALYAYYGIFITVKEILEDY